MANPDTPVTLRLFVALTVPEEVKGRLRLVQDQLRQACGDSGVKWVTSEQMHLTLRFLGNVPAQEVTALGAALYQACSPVATLVLRAERVGFFPGRRNPRVIWAGVSESAHFLPVLHEAVQQATNPFVAEESETKFSAHITLGRVKGMPPARAQLLANAAERFTGALFGEWTASEVHLVRSELSPKGARYSTLQAFPLRTGP